MNEVPPLNSAKPNDAKKQNKNFTLVIIIILTFVVIVSGSFSLYAWQQNKQLTSDVADKDSKITTLQKQQATQDHTTPITNTNPYDGWRNATLKYEKASFKYPSMWTLTNSSTAGGTSGVPQTPGIDSAKLVSPTGLTLVIDTGDGGANGGAYFGTVLSTTPITTLGGNYYLGFGSGGASGSTVTTGGSIGTSPAAEASFPISKNIKGGSGSSVFNVIGMFYSDASGNAISKPVSAFQADASYNDALLIIKSLSY